MKAKQFKFTGIFYLLGRMVSRVAARADRREVDHQTSGSTEDAVMACFPEYEGIPKNKANMQALNWLKRQTRRI
jgi:hypothetical protein